MTAAIAEKPAAHLWDGAEVQGEDAELVIRGLEIYRTRLRQILEPKLNGMQLAIHVEDGDYEVAPTDVEAIRRLSLRHPGVLFALMEVGRPVLEWPWANEFVPVGGA